MDTATIAELQTRRRRWFGALCLLGAIGMLVLDEVVLKGQLGLVAFLGYWLTCFVLTILAILAALADLRAVRIKSLKEQRDLVMETLREIEKEKQTHGQDGQGGGS